MIDLGLLEKVVGVKLVFAGTSEHSPNSRDMFNLGTRVQHKLGRFAFFDGF